MRGDEFTGDRIPIWGEWWEGGKRPSGERKNWGSRGEAFGWKKGCPWWGSWRVSRQWREGSVGGWEGSRNGAGKEEVVTLAGDCAGRKSGGRGRWARKDRNGVARWWGALIPVVRKHRAGGGSGGARAATAAQRRRRRLKGGGSGPRSAAAIASTVRWCWYPWSRQGEAAVSAAARGHATAATEAAVGLLPQPSLSSHLRGRSLFSFFKWRLGFVGGHFPSYRAQNGSRGERAHLKPTTQSLNMLIENKRVHKEKDFADRFPKREEPTRKPKRERGKYAKARLNTCGLRKSIITK